jgi:AP-2 complex subunit alpha
LLRLYRRHPEVVPVSEWAEQLMDLVEDFDLGVNTASYSLVSTLAAAHPDLFAASVNKTVNKLHKVGLFLLFEFGIVLVRFEKKTI